MSKIHTCNYQGIQCHDSYLFCFLSFVFINDENIITIPNLRGTDTTLHPQITNDRIHAAFRHFCFTSVSFCMVPFIHLIPYISFWFSNTFLRTSSKHHMPSLLLANMCIWEEGKPERGYVQSYHQGYKITYFPS